MKKTICILCIFLQSLLCAQLRHKLDSVFSLVKTHSGRDTTLVNLYNDIAYRFTRLNPDSSQIFADKAMALAQILKFRQGIGEAYNNIGINFYLRGAYREAEQQFILSKQIADALGNIKASINRQNNIGIVSYIQGKHSQALESFARSFTSQQKLHDTLGMAGTLNSIASVYIQLADYDKALKSYLQALAYYEKKNDKSGMSQAYNNIGIVYNSLENSDKAIENYEASIKIANEMGEKFKLAPAYSNLGKVYQKKKNIEKATWYYTESLRLSREMNNLPGIAYNLFDLGSIAESKKDYATALKNYSEALAIHEKNNEPLSRANALNRIGNIKLLQGSLAEAGQYFDKALSIGKKINGRNVIADSYSNLATLRKKQGDFKSSYSLFELYAQMRDSILNEDKNKSMAEMQTRFDTDKKEKEIVLLTKNKNIEELKSVEQQANIQKQRVTIYASLGGVTLALSLGFFVLRGYTEKKKANLLLEEKNAAIAAQKHVLEEKTLLITDSIDYACNIQDAILPEETEFKKLFFESFVFFRPKDVVSGDFYWLYRTPANETFLAVVDCVGHGVPGAFMALHSYNLLEAMAMEKASASPAEILDELNLRVIASLDQQNDTASVKHGMDMALIKISGDRVEYAGARNPLVIGGTQEKEIKADAMYVGGAHGKFTNHSLQVAPGTMLFLYTDGYGDQKGGAANKKFFVSEFKKLLQSVANQSADSQKETLASTFDNWKGTGEQIDDVLVIGIRI